MIKLEGVEIKVNQFPNGESAVSIQDIRDAITYNHLSGLSPEVTMLYEDDKDLIALMFIKSFLDESFEKVDLVISYMPYSRMDRANNDYLFTLKYVANFINNMNFARVEVYEAHSDVMMALLNNVTEVTYSRFIAEKVVVEGTIDYLMFPDAGAAKRYMSLSNFLEIDYVVGHKQRDFKTGKITSFDIVGEKDVEGKTILIVDDLSSRGGTFLGAAKALKDKGAKRVELAVTHLENTAESGDLLTGDLIDAVYATNSIYTGKPYDKLKIFEIF